MPITPTYPGVYIEEIPSGVRTITGVATAITAFIGRAKKGTLDDPTLIQSFADFERKFGGLWEKSTMSYAVQHYFLHGGRDALIVRVINGGAKATISLSTDTSTLILEAANKGDWGESLQVSVDYNSKDPATLFNLTIQELSAPGANDILSTETFHNLSMDQNNARFLTKVLEQQSNLVRVTPPITSDRPQVTGDYIAASTNGDDGGDIEDNQISAASLQSDRKGLYALDKADLFNILCIPPLSRENDLEDSTLTNAAAYCKNHRAVFIVDPPCNPSASSLLSPWTDVDKAKAGIDTLRTIIGTDNATNVAVYFPRLKMYFRPYRCPTRHLEGSCRAGSIFIGRS
jgi:phage tail sheath protein FI